MMVPMVPNRRLCIFQENCHVQRRDLELMSIFCKVCLHQKNESRPVPAAWNLPLVFLQRSPGGSPSEAKLQPSPRLNSTELLESDLFHTIHSHQHHQKDMAQNKKGLTSGQAS